MALSPTTYAALERAAASVHRDANTAARTWWRVGGPADALIEIETLAQLQQVQRIASAQGLPLLPLGNGSNLLVSDAGVRGLVVCLGGELARADREGAELHVGGGTKLMALLSRATRRRWPGLGCFAGIPGTIGGAITMNAGARLGETCDVLIDATVVLPGGDAVVLPTADLQMAYRSCDLPDGAVVATARLRLTGDADESRRAIEEHLAYRARTQPTDQRSCGSTFRNPPGDHAGRLVEAAGLKGLTVGGAQVSTKHANFIVNTGGATARDLRTLIERVAQVVREVHGVTLRPEVRFGGDWADWPS